MSALPLVPNHSFQKMRKEAKALVAKPDLPLNKTQQIVAEKYGFKHWKQVTLANGQFQKNAQRYKTHPVFFWDVSDADAGSVESPWVSDSEATIYCHDLLLEKSRIRRCFADREEDFSGFIYQAKWESYEELHAATRGVFFFEPNFVFLDGCFIPFVELLNCSGQPGELEKIETSLVIYDQIEPLLNNIWMRRAAVVLDFSGQFSFNLDNAMLHNASNWSSSIMSDFFVNMDIDHAILMSPPEGIEARAKSVLGENFVDVFEPNF